MRADAQASANVAWPCADAWTGRSLGVIKTLWR